MSADLLRRAVVVLREHAEKAQHALPWCSEYLYWAPVVPALAKVLEETASYYDAAYDDRADRSEMDGATIATIAVARVILREAPDA